MKAILENNTLVLPKIVRQIMAALVVVGIVVFGFTLWNGASERAWQSFLINTVFWGGMAYAGVMLSVIWQITDAKWGRPFKRLAEGYGSFLLWAFGLFMIVAFFGAEHLYEWVESPMLDKGTYLNKTFFIVRSLIGLLILTEMLRWFVRLSIRPDISQARQWLPEWGGNLAIKALKRYGNHETEVVAHEARSRKLAPVVAIIYAVVMSLVAFDYVMSLDQEWYSTLFGVYVFVGHLYSALALLLIIAAFVRRNPEIAEYLTINRFNDLAKLTFAIAMLYSYMAFSQYLVIWYANLPEETPYLITRSLADTPWRPLFWILVGVLFVLPFIALMPRWVCRRPMLTAFIALILLGGQWWAHYLLIVPSIQDRHGEPHFWFGMVEIATTLGFGAGFFLCFFRFINQMPVLPVSDKHLCKTWHGH